VQTAARELMMPLTSIPAPSRQAPVAGDGTDPRGGDRGFYIYVIAMLAVGDTVAAIFVLKTAIDFLL
jgi:hypothetical protein